jgi:hypothetical protein
MPIGRKDAEGAAQFLQCAVKDFEVAPFRVILREPEQSPEDAGKLIGIDKIFLRGQPIVDFRR